jgi:hypothetical protein
VLLREEWPPLNPSPRLAVALCGTRQFHLLLVAQQRAVELPSFALADDQSIALNTDYGIGRGVKRHLVPRLKYGGVATSSSEARNRAPRRLPVLHPT